MKHQVIEKDSRMEVQLQTFFIKSFPQRPVRNLATVPTESSRLI